MQKIQAQQSFVTRTAPQYVVPRSRRRKINRAALITALLSLVVIVPLILVSAVIIYFQINQLNLPGVFVLNEPVGGMSKQATEAWIDQFWNLDRPIRITTYQDPEIAYTFTPQDLGYWVDPQATATAAYNFGRSSEPFTDIISALNQEEKVVFPVLYYDQDKARQTLERLNKDLTHQPKNASLDYSDSEWVALPGKTGQTIDIEATLNLLQENAFTNLLTQSAILFIKPLPPQLSDLSPVLEDIEIAVSQDLVFNAYDPITDEHFAWHVPPENKRSWISVDPQTYDVHLAYNQTDIQNILSTWEQDLGGYRAFKNNPDLNELINNWEKGLSATAIIHHNPTTYQVGRGESLWSISLKLGIPMWYIMDANEGLTSNNLQSGMTLKIPSKNDLLPLPVVPNKRILVDISEQTMTVYENGEVRSTYVVSTGVTDSPTMAGVFQIQTHELNAYASNWDLYMPHFMGIYEAWPGFMNGIHGLPLLSSGQRLWASTLGTPASYGCIILDLGAAEELFYWADPGVVVEITR